MEELVVRPSMKFIKLGYLVVILLIIGATGTKSFGDSVAPPSPWAIPAAFALLLLWPMTALGTGFTKDDGWRMLRRTGC